MEVHLADSSSVFSHQIVHLPLQYADGAIHTVDFRIVLTLNHTIILVMPFLHRINPSVDWKIHTIT